MTAVSRSNGYTYVPAAGTTTVSNVFVYNPSVKPYSFPIFFTPASSGSTLTYSGRSYGVSGSNPAGRTLSRDDSRYGEAFLNKVKQIAKRLNCNYRDLLGVMNCESGINAAARNPNSSATGLIQFMESTARSLGTTTAALAAMSPIDQLDYVEKYIERAKKAAGFSSSHQLTAGELYTLIFMPARAGREVIAQAGDAAYNANRGLDTNRDGKITQSELDARVKSHYVSDNSFLA